MKDFPLRLHHNTPRWVKDGATFHVRIRTHAQQLHALDSPELANALLKAAQRYHESGKWWCDLILLMPDHLHAMLSFPREFSMASTIREWKRGTALIHGVKWQNNFFDHRIRSAQLSAETWHYIRRNPVVKGLCADEEAWPYWWNGTLGTGG